MTEPLRVLLDASALPARPAGAGVYTLELARALDARADVDLRVGSPYDTGLGTWIETPAGALRRNAWQQFKIGRVEADVVHGAHFAVPWRSSVPRVATVHDLTFYRLPRRYGWRHRSYYRALSRLACRAERMIVPSRAVAGDVARYLGYPPERVRVIPEAPRSLTPHPSTQPQPVAHAPGADAAAGNGSKAPYLLCVGTAEPGKRVVDAIRALAAMPEEGRPMLVLAGNEGPLSEALRREAARLGVAERVVFAGYVSDEALGSLMAGAAALVFASLYEGFGLPPLEAMALGTPVIATAAPAMTEVLGDAAAFVPVRDPAAIAREAARILGDASWREELGARGRERAAAYSWERTAEETVAVYREVAA
ncbi:MAG: glycosyltransferase family 1 protein [Dehalococcoidia bacterium]